jgi:hypothetical protein
MAIVVIGGHTRNIGKTSVIASLIAATRDLNWTAIKITQFGHGVCTANGEPCDCETADHPLAISEERDPASGTDTSRYLAAGAVRSIWVRTRQGDLASAMPGIRKEIARAENVILESNSVLRFLQPDFYAAVLDPEVADFKPSALRYLDRANAILLPSAEPAPGTWPGVSARLIDGIPRFPVPPPSYTCERFSYLIRDKLFHVGKNLLPT